MTFDPTPLVKELDAISNMAGDSLRAHIDTVKSIIQSYLDEIVGHALVLEIDTNPFGVAVSVGATLSNALSLIAQAITSIQA
jgi:hypothetical protein